MSTTQLNWEVNETPIFVNGMPVDGYKSIVRSDNGQVLNICKDSYTPTPNSRLIEFSEKITETLGFKHRGYSEFDGGKKVLVHLQNTDTDKTLKIAGCDYKEFLMIGNGHDGSSPFWVGSDATMIRCQNRFARRFRQMSVRHTTSHDVKIDEILNLFDQYQLEKLQYKLNLEKMTKIKINEKLIESLTERLFDIEFKEERLEQYSSRKMNMVENFLESVEVETAELGESLFGLYQGVTHYTSHKTKQVNGIFDRNYNLNQIAYDFAIDILERKN